MIVVHHLNESRSQRVLWLLEEIGVPYDIRFYQRDARTRLAPPELQAVHPLGKSPVLEDEGKTLIESGAIVDYLIRRYGGGRLRPGASAAGRGLGRDHAGFVEARELAGRAANNTRA